MRRCNFHIALLASLCFASGFAEELESSVLARARAARWSDRQLQGEVAVRDVAERARLSDALAILRQHSQASDQNLRLLAQSLLYQHSSRLRLTPSEQASLKKSLLAIWRDPKAPLYAHRQACRALLSRAGAEKQGWFQEALCKFTRGNEPIDETFALEPDRWVKILIPLIGSPDAVVHSAAVYRLGRLCIQAPDHDGLVALLPWLDNERWAEDRHENTRWHIVWAMAKIEIPEAIPYLIRRLEAGHGWERDAAVVLIRNRSEAAREPLQRAVTRLADASDRRDRGLVLAALAANDGYSVERCVDALLAYGELAVSLDGPRKLFSSRSKLSDIQELGQALAENGSTDQVCTALIRRLQSLEPTNPKVVRAIRLAIWGWDCPAAQSYAVECIKGGVSEPLLLRRFMLTRRKNERTTAELTSLAEAGLGFPSGVAAAALGHPGVVKKLLAGQEQQAIRGALAAATASLDPEFGDYSQLNLYHSELSKPLRLPVDSVSSLLKVPELKQATLAYLYMDDTPEARQLLREQNQAADVGFVPMSWRNLADRPGRILSNEIRAGRCDEAWSLFSGGYYGGPGNFLIRRKGTTYTLALPQEPGCELRRELSPKEASDWLKVTRAAHLEARPSLRGEHSHGPYYVYNHVDPKGSQRCFFGDSLSLLGTSASEVVNLFKSLDKPSGYSPHFSALEKNPESALIFSQKDTPAIGVWVQGEDIRIRVVRSRNNPSGGYFIREHGVSVRASEVLERSAWIDLKGNPAKAPISDWPSTKVRTGKDTPLEPSWQSLTPFGYLDRTETGAAFFSENSEPRILAERRFGSFVTTPDGRWAVATVPNGKYWTPASFVRLNLATGEQTPFSLAPSDESYIRSRATGQGVLVSVQRDQNELSANDNPTGPQEIEYYVLTPETMEVRRVSGEVRPLLASRNRPLQSAGDGLYWAALPDETNVETSFGLYDPSRLTFRSLKLYPGITFKSDDLWVDAPSRAVYVLAAGAVLKFPLPEIPE